MTAALALAEQVRCRIIRGRFAILGIHLPVAADACLVRGADGAAILDVLAEPDVRDAAEATDIAALVAEISIARQLIHAADDAAIERSFTGEEITFRLMAWKAEEIGFA